MDAATKHVMSNSLSSLYVGEGVVDNVDEDGIIAHSGKVCHTSGSSFPGESALAREVSEESVPGLSMMFRCEACYAHGHNYYSGGKYEHAGILSRFIRIPRITRSMWLLGPAIGTSTTLQSCQESVRTRPRMKDDLQKMWTNMSASLLQSSTGTWTHPAVTISAAPTSCVAASSDFACTSCDRDFKLRL